MGAGGVAGKQGPFSSPRDQDRHHASYVGFGASISVPTVYGTASRSAPCSAHAGIALLRPLPRHGAGGLGGLRAELSRTGWHGCGRLSGIAGECAVLAPDRSRGLTTDARPRPRVDIPDMSVDDVGMTERGGAVAEEFPTLVGALSQPDAFRGMLDSLADGVYLVDRGRRILFWNDACERITGYAASEVVGHRCFENILRHVDCTGTRLCNGLCPLACTMRDGVPRSDDLWLHHKAGQRVPVSVRTTPIRDAGGEIIGAIEFFTDGSRLEASEEQIAKLRALALTDPLTSLPNRRYAELALSGRLAEVRRHNRCLGVVFADIDRFKTVNDTYGHDIGDDVLRMVATTLSQNVRQGDTATRFGGEEFVLLLPDATSAELRTLAERLCMLVRSSSIDLAPSGELSVTISMGATFATSHDDVAGLLHRADQLLYRSKRGGRDRVTTDSP